MVRGLQAPGLGRGRGVEGYGRRAVGAVPQRHDVNQQRPLPLELQLLGQHRIGAKQRPQLLTLRVVEPVPALDVDSLSAPDEDHGSGGAGRPHQRLHRHVELALHDPGLQQAREQRQRLTDGGFEGAPIHHASLAPGAS